MTHIGKDTLKTIRTLRLSNSEYRYFSLKAAEKSGLRNVSKLPFSLKILLENLLRHEDGYSVKADDLKSFPDWLKRGRSGLEIAFRPSRVLMQDFTGVPALADLAAMRDAMQSIGGDPELINPISPVDLVIDHSLMVDRFGTMKSFLTNVNFEYERNAERYSFLRWGQDAFSNFRVVPPGTGICHQVNLEYLSLVVRATTHQHQQFAFPDTLVGTDSHTTMVNGLAVLGWGVGGIEAEAAMLGQPISMRLPEVVGFKLTGKLREGTTSTDLVLTVTEMLRRKGVVNKFVEFFGSGLDQLSLPDRATIANMAPEYGATCGFFPVDRETIAYLEATSRSPEQVRLVEAYAKAQGMWRHAKTPEPRFSSTLKLDVNSVEPCLAGPKRPQDRIPLSRAGSAFVRSLSQTFGIPGHRKLSSINQSKFDIKHGDIVIAAITSCTNTSNPHVMLGAGLLARNAVAKGLTVKPWVKTSLAPGSKVVTDYLMKADLQDSLNKLGFNLVGYGCTTCIGNSGPLPEKVSNAIKEKDLVVCSVLSGNRNFEGRISPQVKANYLCSPMLVVAYAIAGSMEVSITQDSLGLGNNGKHVYLKDIWPKDKDIRALIKKVVSPAMFRQQYSNVFSGDRKWQQMTAPIGITYDWNPDSTYVRKPPFFATKKSIKPQNCTISAGRVLMLLGDSITTDHISPAGAINVDSAAGKYLTRNNIRPEEFNSYGSRRGNHEIMMRGTFANIRLRNELVSEAEGGFTRHFPSGNQMSVYDAAMLYRKEGVPLVVIAGKEYGTGSSRDWAAKGPRLLGVRAVIAESFERIHRSNLVGMGILPLLFQNGIDRKSLHLDGTEVYNIYSPRSELIPQMELMCKVMRPNGKSMTIKLLCQIDTEEEVEYYTSSGVLQYVLRKMINKNP